MHFKHIKRFYPSLHKRSFFPNWATMDEEILPRNYPSLHTSFPFMKLSAAACAFNIQGQTLLLIKIIFSINQEYNNGANISRLKMYAKGIDFSKYARLVNL